MHWVNDGPRMDARAPSPADAQATTLPKLGSRTATEPRQAASRPEAGRPRSLALAYDSHKNNFGFLRFFLATAVVWSHSYALAGRPSDPVWALSRQIDGGSIAVDGFFVLSGFLVTQSWVQQPALRIFAVKRLLRLVPALLVATIFGAFVIGPLGTTWPFTDYISSPDPWLHFLGVPLNRYLFLTPSFVDNPYPHLLNSPLWSLRYEILCYALLALLAATWGRRLGKLSLALFGLSWLTFVLLPASISPLSILVKTPRLVACFSAGMVLFLYRDRITIAASWAAAAALLLIATFFAGGFSSAVPWAGAYLLICFACWQKSRLENFCRYGDFSYGIYIFACPIQQLLLYYLSPAIPIALFFVLAYVPTVVLAALSWHFVEAPALRLKKTVVTA